MRLCGVAALLLAGLLLCGSNAVADPPLPPRTGAVVDLANLLEPFQEQSLATQFGTLKARTGVDFVVVTLPSLQGYAVESWGRLLGNRWVVGGKSGLGALLIVAPNDREVRIEIGDALSVMFPDSAATAIIDREILPKFRAGRLSSGILAGADAMIDQATRPALAVERSAPAKQGISAPAVERSGSDDWSWLRSYLPSQGHMLVGILVLVVLFVLYRIRAWRILDVSGDGGYPGLVDRGDGSMEWFWNSTDRYDPGAFGVRPAHVILHRSRRSSGFALGGSNGHSSVRVGDDDEQGESGDFRISWGSGGFRGSGGSRSFGGSSIGRSSGGGFSGRGASGRW